MSKAEIATLRKRIESASSLDGRLLSEAFAVLCRVFPNAPEAVGVTSEPVEEVLHLVDIFLPGWTIQLIGKAMEPDGHWRCSLRVSRGTDEDEMIGLGTGAVVGLALLDALLHVAHQKGIVA